MVHCELLQISSVSYLQQFAVNHMSSSIHRVGIRVLATLITMYDIHQQRTWLVKCIAGSIELKDIISLALCKVLILETFRIDAP